mgnify:CR=1 FL=1
MIKTWFKEYEKIKDKAVVVYPYEWDCMSEKQRNKILSKKADMPVNIMRLSET